MYAGIRSPAIHRPKTLNDLSAISSRFPNAIFWAGGTYIMSRPNYYPNKESSDIISLAEITELKRINRTDRYLEVGAMVTLDQLLLVGRQILPDPLTATLQAMGTKIVRKQATIGGTLCTKALRLALSGSLAVLDTEVEIRTFDSFRSGSRWINIAKLYNQQGRLLLEKNELVSRIRIGFEEENFTFFHTVGKPITSPHECASLALVSSFNQSIVTDFRFYCTLPYGGFHKFPHIEVLVKGETLPFSPQQISRFANMVSEALESTQIAMKLIQRERLKRFFEIALHQLNTQSLSVR